jgi:hypothetical protein
MFVRFLIVTKAFASSHGGASSDAVGACVSLEFRVLEVKVLSFGPTWAETDFLLDEARR